MQAKRCTLEANCPSCGGGATCHVRGAVPRSRYHYQSFEQSFDLFGTFRIPARGQAKPMIIEQYGFSRTQVHVGQPAAHATRQPEPRAAGGGCVRRPQVPLLPASGVVRGRERAVRLRI